MEKSDKKSIIIASIFLVILFGCLGFVIFIKMTYGDKNLNNVNNNVVVPQGLTLTQIVTSFNNSNKVKNSLDENATINMIGSEDSFVINYSTQDVSISLNGNYTGTLLSLTYNPSVETEENLVAIVFDELVNISCVYNGYNEGECSETVNKLFEGNASIEGLGYSKNSETQTLLVVDTSKKIPLYTAINTYVNNDIISIDIIDYVITGNNFELNKPLLEFDEESNSFMYSATIRKLDNNLKEVKIVLKLYDENKNEVSVSEIDKTNISDINEFELSLSSMFDEGITKENVKYFSVDFVTE